MTSRTPKRAAVEPSSPAPAREPGPSVSPVTDGPGTLDGAAGDTTRIPTVRRAPSSRLLPVSGPRRAAAGIPSPDTGAARLDRGAAPARGRSPQTPAGGAAAEPAPSAGSAGRTYTIALPPGLKLLSLNDRLHWSERARRTEALKKAAWALALQAKIPPLERVAVIAEYRPPGVRRRRDAENIPAPSAKACLDGIVQAGVLPDDECPRYVSKIACTIGEPYPKGRLVLYLIEVPAAGGAA